MQPTMTKDQRMDQKAPPPAMAGKPSDSQKKLRLAELLARSMEDDAIIDNTVPDLDRERWDDDEGSFGG
jgi:hypothetical protein